MGLEFKPDWEECRPRLEAWWQGQILDRVPVMVTAPLREVNVPQPAASEMEAYWTDPEQVVPRLLRSMEATYYAGECVPVMFPVSTGIPAILAAYLGCPLRFLDIHTAWADPVIDDWEGLPPLEFDPDNRWWRLSAALLEAGSEGAPGRYLVGYPDLNGPGEVLARMRGTEALCFDVIERPAAVEGAQEKIAAAWYRCYQACMDIIHRHVPGSMHWMGIWSMTPSVDLQCDFSCMVSPAAFDELFLPFLRKQTEWVPRTIYHLDGPNAVRHLPVLLSLPKLTGIQWVPGAGTAPMSEWVELLRRILEAGKLLYIACQPGEVEFLLSKLPQKGLLLRTSCQSPQEADALLEDVARWTR
jgi:5-methyltetrahydrofolate--homocysteine methyltransferase